jgi:hypothetical protein
LEGTQSDTAFAVRLGESKGCLNPTHGCCLMCPLRFAVLVAPLGTNRGAPAILMLRPPQVKKNPGPRFFLIALTMGLYNPASRRADSLKDHAVRPLQRGLAFTSVERFENSLVASILRGIAIEV